MSTCLSSRGCGFDLEHMVKWLCTNSSRTTSNSSSPSSTLSESSNSPRETSTRKPRTPRKRPNQTYNEAAALLSMACPNFLNTKYLTKRTTNLPKFTKICQSNFFNNPPELISQFPVIENSGFLLQQRILEKPCSLTESKVVNLSPNAREIESNCVCVNLSDECFDDFDAESILDEEIEQGIDSIMGVSNSIIDNNELNDDTCYGYPIGLGFGVRNGVRALKNCDERNRWNSPMVDVVNLSPAVVAKFEKSPVGKKKKKKKKKVEELMKSEQGKFRLKLNYDAVLLAWSDKELPVPEEIWQAASPAGDIHARAANIDLFSENGGWSESSATRSTDKIHFKKIKHQLKDACSDRRPRCKGRFVKKPNSAACDEET